MQGPPGAGKSHLLSGHGIRAIQPGFSVQHFRFDELLTALKTDAHLPPARLKSRKYMSSSLLLVDEMGYDPMSREEASARRRSRTGGARPLALPAGQLPVRPRGVRRRHWRHGPLRTP